MVSTPSLGIIYFGTPEFAVPTLRRLLDSSHSVLAVVSQPDRPRGRGHRLEPTATKAVAVERHIPVLQPERVRDEAFLERVRAIRPDLGVVAAYGKLLPEALLGIPRCGTINVHASILPRWRGAAPVHRAVIAGDRETGVTIMRVVKELDAGPTFAMIRRPIRPDETSVEVEQDLAESGAALLLDVVGDIAAGTAVETPQDDARATYAPKLTKDEGVIDWSLTAEEIHNRVRGLQPWPLASARLGAERVLLHRTSLTGETAHGVPGAVVRASGDAFDVAAGDGQVLRIVSIQPEGRRTMTAREYLAGRHVEPGSRFERA